MLLLRLFSLGFNLCRLHFVPFLEKYQKARSFKFKTTGVSHTVPQPALPQGHARADGVGEL